MDIQKQMQEEAAELQMWQEVAQLSQAGTPDAMPKIAQIAAQAIQAQEAEMKELQGGEENTMQTKESGMDRIKKALIAREQAQQAQPSEGQPQE